LIDTFQEIAGTIPRARLIIKDSGEDSGTIERQKSITYISSRLTDAELNALYDLADVYVSPHHAEGWGLTMSDAILFKKPIVATGYSGNLEFMDQETALLVDYREEYIRPSDQVYLFDGGMKWAYPVRTDLEDKLIWCYENAFSKTSMMLQRGSENARRFSPAAVEQRLVSRLAAICA
jgi:glycosyltransferase involved in cell wall biosynthesis